jgi:hypothetical protein
LLPGSYTVPGLERAMVSFTIEWPTRYTALANSSVMAALIVKDAKA